MRRGRGVDPRLVFRFFSWVRLGLPRGRLRWAWFGPPVGAQCPPPVGPLGFDRRRLVQQPPFQRLKTFRFATTQVGRLLFVGGQVVQLKAGPVGTPQDLPVPIAQGDPGIGSHVEPPVERLPPFDPRNLPPPLRQHVHPVEHPVGWRGHPGDSEQGGEQVAANHRSRLHAPRRDLPRPADQPGNPDPPFMQIALAAPQPPGRTPARALHSIPLGAVVRRKNHAGVLRELQVVEALHQLAKRRIQLGHVGMVRTLHLVGQLGVQGLESRIRLDGVVRFVGPDGQEERLVALPFRLQPAHRLADHQRGRVALERPHRLPVPHKVPRVVVRGVGVVLGGQPPVVTMLPRLGVPGLVEQPIQMPLARVTGGVPRLAQQLGEGDFTGTEVHGGPFGDPGEDPVAVRRAARQQGRPRRTADRARRVALRQPEPLLRERIEMRCLDERVPLAAQVAPPQVIGEEQDDIRPLGRGEPASPAPDQPGEIRQSGDPHQPGSAEQPPREGRTRAEGSHGNSRSRTGQRGPPGGGVPARFSGSLPALRCASGRGR